MNTCKDCKHYTPEGDFDKTGLCDMVNTSYHFPVEADKRITYLEAEHGAATALVRILAAYTLKRRHETNRP